jgi:hypothetical protein
LANAISEDDEWWRLIKIGELVVRAKLLDAYKSSNGQTSYVWGDIINALWNHVLDGAGTVEMRHKNFRYTEPVSKKVPEPAIISSPSDGLYSMDCEI